MQVFDNVGLIPENGWNFA